jgi:ankyrin repeat protein
MTHALERLRRQAKILKSNYEMGNPNALARIRRHPPRSDGSELRHADFLHVIAKEQSFASWPQLKLAVETQGMDRATKQQRLKIAVYHGQNWVIQQLLWDTPDLAKGMLGLEIALYDLAAVQLAIEEDPRVATTLRDPRSPILHLAFSKYLSARPELQDDMIAIGELLLVNGADVNDSTPVDAQNNHPLSALYGALGHAGNMPLAQWLLEHGADPNDGESLYHATELGHHRGLELLLKHGVDVNGQNALPRALDFNDPIMVRLLLDAGADPNVFKADPVGGESPWVIPSLHQAARRMCAPEIVEMLLDAGANLNQTWRGTTAYVYACVYGNAPMQVVLERAGADTQLTDIEILLANAAKGKIPPKIYIDTATMHEDFRDLIRLIVHLPDAMPHVRALVGLGLEYDRPDAQGIPPVQIAGWEGLPDMMAYLLSLGPDLSHVNGYGGTLLGTILHGSENNPVRSDRDYLECPRLALEHGAALPQRMVDLAGEEAMAEFLQDWAKAHPGQVAEGSIG